MWRQSIKNIQDLEKRLKWNESLLSSIFDNAPNLMFIKDVQDGFRYTYINHSTEVFSNKEISEIIGKTDFEIYPATDAVRFRTQDELVVKTKSKQQFESFVNRGMGTRFYITTKFPVMDDTGEVRLICGIATDITDKHDEQLKRAEASNILVQAQKLAGFGSWIWDIENDQYIWSDTMYHIFDYDPDQKPSFKKIEARIVPEMRSQVTSRMEQFLESASTEYESEYRIHRRNKEVRQIFTKAQIQRNELGKPVKIVGITQDVTEQRTYENRILEIQQSLMEAQRLGMNGNMVWNFDTDEVFYSDMMYEIFAVDRSHTNIRQEFYDRIHPDDREMVADIQSNFLQGTETELSLNYRILLPDGTLKYVESFVRLFRHEDGRPHRLVGAAQDITERKQHETLRREMISELVVKNRELSHFNYIISHNLRAPVANLLGLSALFDANNLNRERNLEIIENIRESATNLDRVITDLNYILSIRTGIDEARERVNINEVLAEVLNLLNDDISRCGADISFELEACSTVRYVRSYLHSILYNLIGNAIKYRKPDVPLRVKVSTELRNKTCLLTVSDNAMGIDLKKYHDKIFGLYKRFHHQIEGKGLGLYLVKVQAEAMGGKVEVESNPGEGSVFAIHINL